MKKRWLFLFLPLALLACRTLFPDRPVFSTKTPIPVATSHLEATAFASGSGFTLVRIHPNDGTLQNLLAAEAKKAQALGQRLFVEFDATWCPPCQAITASLVDRNKLMFAAYRGVYLVHVDVDEWGWGNPGAGFSVQAVPVFFKLDQDGKPSGPNVDGGAWGEDIPENIAPVLAGFFHP